MMRFSFQKGNCPEFITRLFYLITALQETTISLRHSWCKNTNGGLTWIWIWVSWKWVELLLKMAGVTWWIWIILILIWKPWWLGIWNSEKNIITNYHHIVWIDSKSITQITFSACKCVSSPFQQNLDRRIWFPHVVQEKWSSLSDHVD